MTETEIERLVVRLTGDATSYVKMLTDAQHKTQDAAKKVEEAANKIEKFQKGLEGFAATATKVLGAVGIASGLKEMYNQFDEADDRITEMTAIIEANGRSALKVIPHYKKFAEEMEAVTTSSKYATLEMLKQAETLGLSGERAQKAVKTAITLGNMKNADPTSFMRQAVNFEKTGNASGLARILGLMGEMEEDTTKAAEAAKLLEKNWALVVAKGEDGGAKLQRSINVFKEIGKDAGEVISRAVEPMIDYIAKGAKAFQEIDPAIRKTIAAMIILVASIYPVITAYGILAPKIVAVGVALKGVGLAMAANPFSAVFVVALTAAMIALTYHTNKYNEAIAKSKELGSQVVANQIKRIEQEDAYQKEKNRGSYEDQLKKAKDDLERMQNKSVGRPGMSSLLPGVVGVMDLADKHLFGGSEEIELQKQKIKELQEVYDAYVANKKNAMKSANANETGASKETIAAVDDLTSSLKTQLETVGMSSEQAQIYALRQKTMGDAALNASLDIAEHNVQMLEAAKAQRAAIDSAKGLIKSMEFQIATWGMSESAALRYKLTMEGVDDATVDRAVALQEELEWMEDLEKIWDSVGESVKETKEQYQALNAVVAGGADAAQLVYQYGNQFGEDTKAVNKAATMRRADFTAQPDRNFLGPQLKGADAMKETEKKLDDLKTVLEQIRDKEQIALEGADLVA